MPADMNKKRAPTAATSKAIGMFYLHSTFLIILYQTPYFSVTIVTSSFSRFE
jgi:hypothetical protein